MSIRSIINTSNTKIIKYINCFFILKKVSYLPMYIKILQNIYKFNFTFPIILIFLNVLIFTSVWKTHCDPLITLTPQSPKFITSSRPSGLMMDMQIVELPGDFDTECAYFKTVCASILPLFDFKISKDAIISSFE